MAHRYESRVWCKVRVSVPLSRHNFDASQACLTFAALADSMEIVRRRFRARDREWPDALHFHRDHVLLILQFALD
jgi:hypothetical protein